MEQGMGKSDKATAERPGMDADGMMIIIRIKEDKTEVEVHDLTTIEAIGTLEIAKSILLKEEDVTNKKVLPEG
jgi:hypothetical protein